MVVGRDGDALDALVLWFGGSWSFGFLGFLFCLNRTGGFFLGCTWDWWAISFWDAGFLSFLSFPLFRGTVGFSLFFSRSGGSGVLSHGAGFGLGFHG